jgi:hypothetical protein
LEIVKGKRLIAFFEKQTAMYALETKKFISLLPNFIMLSQDKYKTVNACLNAMYDKRIKAQ